MRKKIFLSFLLLNSIIANNTHAADDRISNLILKVNAKANNNADIDLIENKLLGRASWKIKCQYKVFEDMKACVVSKGPISRKTRSFLHGACRYHPSHYKNINYNRRISTLLSRMKKESELLSSGINQYVKFYSFLQSVQGV